LFVDERGQPVPGAWPGSPKPNEHDILTGSTAEGRVVPGKTCNDWTSESPDMQAQVGHVDGIGLVAIPREPPVRGTRRMRVEAAPIPLPEEVRADSTASRRSKNRALIATLVLAPEPTGLNH